MSPDKTEPDSRRGRFAAGLLSVLALAASPLAASVDPDFRPMGEGQLAWFGIELYNARLATPNGTYQRGQPAALSIQYLKPIRSDRLVDRTRKEWRRLERRTDLPAVEAREAWLAEVTTIWPDVSPGDTITTLVDDSGATTFLLNGTTIGTVDDPQFGPAFLDIWLHPETRSASLRSELLGRAGDGR